MKTTEIGRCGEMLAAEYLHRKGYHIVGKNVHIGHLEIDLVAENDTQVLFIEVKTRTDIGAVSKFGSPGSAVDMKKRQHLTEAVRQYLYRYPTVKKPRIDVIEVYLWRKGSNVTLSPKGIKHIENALL